MGLIVGMKFSHHRYAFTCGPEVGVANHTKRRKIPQFENRMLDVRFGSLADIGPIHRDVRFTPKADISC